MDFFFFDETLRHVEQRFLAVELDKEKHFLRSAKLQFIAHWSSSVSSSLSVLRRFF